MSPALTSSIKRTSSASASDRPRARILAGHHSGETGGEAGYFNKTRDDRASSRSLIIDTPRRRAFCCTAQRSVCIIASLIAVSRFSMNFSLIPADLRAIAEKVAAASASMKRKRSHFIRSNDLERARDHGQRRAGAEERQLRHLHSQPLHQLLEHLHPLLPVLCLRRARSATRMPSNTRSMKSSPRCKTRSASASPRCTWSVVCIRRLKKDWYLRLAAPAARARSRAGHQSVHRDRNSTSAPSVFQTVDSRRRSRLCAMLVSVP